MFQYTAVLFQLHPREKKKKLLTHLEDTESVSIAAQEHSLVL